MKETCAYCEKHVWHDAKEVHVCLKDHEPKKMDDTCSAWRLMKRCFGVVN